MGLLDQIKKDTKKFASNLNDFATEMTFTDKAYNNATISGLYARHSTKIEDGQVVDGTNVSCTISESKLIDAGYQVRDENNEVIMKNHFVSFTDTTGISKKYKIIRSLPDETVGLIVFICSEYAEN